MTDIPIYQRITLMQGRADLILTLVDGSNGSQPHGIHKAGVAFAELHLKEIHNNADVYHIYT